MTSSSKASASWSATNPTFWVKGLTARECRGLNDMLFPLGYRFFLVREREMVPNPQIEPQHLAPQADGTRV